MIPPVINRYARIETTLFAVCYIFTFQWYVVRQAQCQETISSVPDEVVTQMAQSWQEIKPQWGDVYGYEFKCSCRMQMTPESEVMREWREGTYIRRGSFHRVDMKTTFPGEEGGPLEVIRSLWCLGPSKCYRAHISPKGSFSVNEEPLPPTVNLTCGLPEFDPYFEVRRFQQFTRILTPEYQGPKNPNEYWEWPVKCRKEDDGTYSIFLRIAPGEGRPNLAFRVYVASLDPEANLLGWDEGKMKEDTFHVGTSFRMSYLDWGNGYAPIGSCNWKSYQTRNRRTEEGRGEVSWVQLELQFEITRVLSLEEVSAAPTSLYLPPGSEIKTLDGNVVHVYEEGRELHLQ